MESTSKTELIQLHFDYLFKDYGFFIVSETHFESFGNWIVVLSSHLFRVHFLMDRGSLDLKLGPLWSSPDWKSGPWHSLGVVIEFLTDSQDTDELTLDRVDVQMERLSEKLYRYFDQIQHLFHVDVYPLKRDQLRAFAKDRRMRILDELTKKTTGE